MLIIVGVVLDTMKQIETVLLQRHYDGFLKKVGCVDDQLILIEVSNLWN